jgi:predicted ester cyclase
MHPTSSRRLRTPTFVKTALRWSCTVFSLMNSSPEISTRGATSASSRWRQTAALFREAFPDWHSDVELYVAEGDLVAERFTARGTHQGEIMGVAPTGQQVSLAGINIFRIRDGAIVERWGRLDELGFLRQLGVIPSS